MEKNTLNALYRYFEALYEMNQNLIVLCGMNVIDNRYKYGKILENVIQAIPRLVPYEYKKKAKAYEINFQSGLMQFSSDIQYLASGYTTIFQKHKNFLIKVKKIRNKLEHEMHSSTVIASSNGIGELFNTTYDICGEKVSLNAGEIISFTKDLNTLFARIQNDVEHDLDDNVEKNSYILKLIRFVFTEFNKIYESNLLPTFGKALLPF